MLKQIANSMGMATALYLFTWIPLAPAEENNCQARWLEWEKTKAHLQCKESSDCVEIPKCCGERGVIHKNYAQLAKSCINCAAVDCFEIMPLQGLKLTPWCENNFCTLRQEKDSDAFRRQRGWFNWLFPSGSSKNSD